MPAIIIACTLLLSLVTETTALAGMKTFSTSVTTSENTLNNTDWNFMGDIQSKDNKVIISAESSDAETKIISKNVATAAPELEEMVSIETTMKLTALPSKAKFILAFGLSNIEAQSQEDGNVELVITNQNGLKLAAVAYSEGQEIVVVEAKNMGASLKKDFKLNASVTATGVLKVSVNGTVLCEKQLPVSGEGRFGVLQTGQCGAEISNMKLICREYERPENIEISEDFENADFNINELCSRIISVGMAPASFAIKDYNGNKVMMFQNTAAAFIGTKYTYSNFELSFDIPYWPGEDICDENGNVTVMKGHSLCIGIGEPSSDPKAASFADNMDLIRLNKDSAVSELRSIFNIVYNVAGMPKVSDDEGYSVKLTLVDGHVELFVKPLEATNYTLVASADYDVQQSGYINLWTTTGGTVAIDNIKITNLDKNPNLLTVEHQTSVLENPDYDITQESAELVFRPGNSNKKRTQFDEIYFVGGCAIVAVIILAAGATVRIVRKKKANKGGDTDASI